MTPLLASPSAEALHSSRQDARQRTLHVARTVCRRGERLIVGVNREVGGYDEILVYFNRLSDLLFVLAWSSEVMAVVEDAVQEVMTGALR